MRCARDISSIASPAPSIKSEPEAHEGTITRRARGTSIGGSAVLLAARQVRDKARRFAAAMLEANEEDIVVADGRYAPCDVPERGVTHRGMKA